MTLILKPAELPSAGHLSKCKFKALYCSLYPQVPPIYSPVSFHSPTFMHISNFAYKKGKKKIEYTAKKVLDLSEGENLI